ncbi:hypothetical protein [Streptomyces sp. NPDC018693]|uniref:hypothetical protein n=1 Tax=unclassified Streptomyces TaxID=2593676 RepID=UPI0037B5DC91
MRSVRTLLVTAAGSAVLVLGAPGAYAVGSDHEDSSYSKEHGKDHGKDQDKEHGKDGRHDKPHGGVHTGGGALTVVGADDWSKEHGKEHGKDGRHDKPHGGVHTGGGALTAVNADGWGTAWDPKYDPETYKDKGSGYGKDSTSGDHGKPRGGMHTGGGALATPSVTAGGAAVLAVAATGLYAVRRRKTSESAV